MKDFVIIPSLILAFTFVSCKKESSFIGKNGIDQNDLLVNGAIDTFQLETYSELEDSALSSNTETALLGSYVDPVFGKVRSEFYTQLKLEGLNPDFGDLSTIVIDSFVLGLEYRSYYGKLDPQKFEVYRLAQGLSMDSTYYSFQTRAVEGLDLLDPNKSVLIPDPTKQIKIGSNMVGSQLRLYLDTNLARTLMAETKINPAVFSSNENFIGYFKGLNVRSNNTNQAEEEGAILYFNLTAPNSKLTIYYKSNGVQKDFDFLIDGSCADFNHVSIDNEGKKPKQLITNPGLGSQEFYAQANYARGLVKIPYLNKIPKNSVIQYAKLELPVSFYSLDPYFPSSILGVSTKINFTDERLYSIKVVGEYSDLTKSYVIDLKDYIQQILSKNIENRGVYVSPSRMVNSAERIVFNGSNTIYKKKPKLYLIYTTF